MAPILRKRIILCLLAVLAMCAFYTGATPPPPQEMADKASRGDTEAEVNLGLHYEVV